MFAVSDDLTAKTTNEASDLAQRFRLTIYFWSKGELCLLTDWRIICVRP